jgi:hypothetical protein
VSTFQEQPRVRVTTTLGRAVQIYGEFAGRSLIALALVLTALNFVYTVFEPVGESAWTTIVFLAATVVGTAWAETVLVADIDAEQRGEREASVLELFGRTWRPAVRVATATLLASLVIGLVFVVAFFVATLLVVDEWTLLVAFLVAAAPALFLWARWSLLLPVIVIEQRAVSTAFGRSTQLVLPHRWTVFTVVLIGFAVGIVFGAVLVSVVEAYTSGLVQLWLVSFVDGLIYASLMVAISTALYYELMAKRADSPTSSEWRDAPSRAEADLDITRFAR